MYKEHFARSQEFSYSLGYIGRYYRDYMDLMAHFEAVLPGRVCHVIYESLVTDTETEVRRMLDYCGLPFEEACLAFHETRQGSKHRELGAGQEADLHRGARALETLCALAR
ncbi:MAG: sulfotransferase [Woeseiaceae bacterium]|nr:sulfotransferase [Woeseiaceae bacterium]